jgi:hypothetical protein
VPDNRVGLVPHQVIEVLVIDRGQAGRLGVDEPCSRGSMSAAGTGGSGGGKPASSRRCRCWSSDSSSARASASMTWIEAEMSRPCSSQVYQVTPTPDSWAISSRRNPGVRRLPDALPSGRPTSAGASRARQARRNAPSSVRRAVCASWVAAGHPRSSWGPGGAWLAGSVPG